MTLDKPSRSLYFSVSTLSNETCAPDAGHWRPGGMEWLMSLVSSPCLTGPPTTHTQLCRETVKGAHSGRWHFHLADCLFTVHSFFLASFKSWILLRRNHTNTSHSPHRIIYTEVGVWVETRSHQWFWICNRSDRILFCLSQVLYNLKVKRLL